MAPEHSGLASGLVGTSHELGAAIGVAALASGGFTTLPFPALALALAAAALLPSGRLSPTAARAMAH
ncbi:hypothetical protein [Streptomyces sp. NPDC048357]|uniref:hypothetical protein n=1 Tax=Streptomyces sp. NPDC048357 TaxID=3154719 RepID=UPI00343A6ABC